jgi:hypothetical protein
MRILLILFALSGIFSVFSCKVNDKNPMLIGRWKGTEWLIMDKLADVDANMILFEFKDDATYTAALGSQVQTGTWRTQADKLFTTEKGKQEIMVKLLRADGEVLEFEMNRGGQKEIMKLAKQ